MHKARDYIENNVANNIPWQCSSVIYAGERPVLFESSKSQPFAYNKTIDQENVIPSFNINLLDRENKFVNQLTLVPDNTSYYNRNGLPYSINNNSCSRPYKQKCSDNMFDNMVYSQPSVVTSVDGLGYPNRFKTQTDRRYGTNIVATNKPYWINEEYKMEHDRNYTNPTNSKGNIFSTSKQLRNVTNLKQQPLPIYNEKDIKDTKPYNIYKPPSTNIKYSKIYNTRDVDYTNIEDNIYNSKGDKGFLNTPDVIKYNLNIDVTKQPLKQIKSRFNTIDNDFNNNLPIYMQNIDRSILLEKAGKLQNNYRKDTYHSILSTISTYMTVFIFSGLKRFPTTPANISSISCLIRSFSHFSPSLCNIQHIRKPVSEYLGRNPSSLLTRFFSWSLHFVREGLLALSKCQKKGLSTWTTTTEERRRCIRPSLFGTLLRSLSFTYAPVRSARARPWLPEAPSGRLCLL